LDQKQIDKWLTKKKASSQYWQIKNLFKGLRLKYKEEGKNTEFYALTVPLFGLKVRFSGVSLPNELGWEVFFVPPEKLENRGEVEGIRESIFWFLVQAGYFAYIREIEGGAYTNIFTSLLITQGWAEKIMRKRVELCGKEPCKNFMKVRTEEFLGMSVNKILAYSPGFFDYLM